MEKKITFIDANGNKVVLEISVSMKDAGDRKIRNWEDLSIVPRDKMKVLSVTGNVAGCYGQVINEINPRTGSQWKLAELWEEYHLNDMCPGTKAQTEYLKSDKYKEDFNYLSNFFTSCDYEGIIEKCVVDDIKYTLEGNKYYFLKGKLNDKSLSPSKKGGYEVKYHSLMRDIWLQIGNKVINNIIREKLNGKGVFFNPKYRDLFDLYTGKLKNPDMNDFTYRKLLLEWNGLEPGRDYKYGSSWLFKVLPDNIEDIIDSLCNDIEREERERRDSIVKELNDGKDENEIKDFRMSQDDDHEKDKEHVRIVMEAMDLDEDHAMRLVALGKVLGEYLLDMLHNFEEVDGSQLLYEYRGHRYYIGTGEELYDVAKEVVENDPEMKCFWKQAVEANATEEGFEEWRDSIVDVDGFESILDHYDGRGHSVEVMRQWVNICDEG